MVVLVHLLNPGDVPGYCAGQALVRDAPFTCHHLMQQGLSRNGHGKHLQRMAQRLVDALDLVHSPSGRQDLRGIRVLSLFCLEQAISSNSLLIDVTAGRRRSHGRAQAKRVAPVVKAWICKRQTRQIRPVNLSLYSMCSLPVQSLFFKS